MTDNEIKIAIAKAVYGEKLAHRLAMIPDSPNDLNSMHKPKMSFRRHKYNAVKTIVDGHVFPSKAEAKRYGELKLLEKAGEISELVLQPRFDLRVNGIHICHYIADFSYVEWKNMEIVVEDVKGFVTDLFRIKKRLMKACCGIDVQEVRK